LSVSISFGRKISLKSGLINNSSSKDLIKKNIIYEIKSPQISNPFQEDFDAKSKIESLVKTNFCIIKLLNSYNLPIKINIDILENLKQGHLKTTSDIAAKIYSALPSDLKNEVNIFDLKTAAIMHDYGKILIPSEILNKKGKLNAEEREIMQLHSELGYELLKNSGLSERVLKLIKYHHQNLQKSGYPHINSDFDFGIDFQILNVADKYTALREKRCYKNPLAKYETLEIIAKDVRQGLISQEVYTALVKSV